MQLPKLKRSIKMRILFESLKDLFNSENEFFNYARSGKRITHIALAIPLVIIFIFGSMIISGIPGQLLVDYFDLGKPVIEFYNLFVSFGILIIVVWLWVRFFEKRSIKTLGFTGNNAFKKYIKGFISAIIMLSIVLLLMTIFGKVGFNENPKPLNLNLWGIFLLMLIGYVVQGAAEEILVRGWQFQVIGARYKPWLGLVISSVIFALLHGTNNGVSMLAIINLLLFAILLILFILYEKSIWAACGWHTAWNWSMENVFGLKVSGSEGLGSMLNLTAEGPNYITGGNFGPEGSILTSFVLFGGMIVLLFLNSKKLTLNK
jgi:hypothetical protein